MIQQTFSSMRKQVNKDRPGFAVWERIGLRGLEEWSSVCYGNGIFVTVGYAGTNRVASSPDGIYWSKNTIPMRTWTSVAYGNGTFVAVSYEGSIATSTDSINWTVQTTPVTLSLVSIVYGKGSFKALGEKGILSSTDGVTWTEDTLPAGATDGTLFSDITYGGGNFLVISRMGNKVMMSSGDGNWITQTVRSNKWASVCYGRGLYVVVAHEPTGVEGEDQDTPRIMICSSTFLWRYIEAPTNANFVSVCYGDGIFVAYGYASAGRNVMASDDGNIWRLQRDTPAIAFMGSAYGNGLHISVSATGADGKGIKSGSGPIMYEGLAVEI